MKTVFQIADRYIKQRAKQEDYWVIIKHYNRYLGCDFSYKGHLAWLEVDEDKAIEYVRYMSENYAGATAAKYVGFIKTLYRLVSHCHSRVSNPYLNVRTPSSQVNKKRACRAATSEEVMRLFERLGDDFGGCRDRLVYCLLFYEAFRVSEVCKLKLKDVCLDQWTITLARPKERRHSVVSLQQATIRALTKYIEFRGTSPGYVIVSFLNKIERPTKRNTINYRLKRACEEMGIKQMTSHCGRVTAVTRALDMGIPIKNVQKKCRHSSAAITLRYYRSECNEFEIEYE